MLIQFGKAHMLTQVTSRHASSIDREAVALCSNFAHLRGKQKHMLEGAYLPVDVQYRDNCTDPDPLQTTAFPCATNSAGYI